MVPDVHLLVRTAALMAFAIAFAGLCAKVLEDKRRRPLEPSSEEGHTEVDSFESLLRDSKRLIEWLDKESPVKDTREDYFDLRVYAGRIVDVLRETPLRTVAIVGPYGCGKSSTLNMVDSYLSRARLCWVEFNSNYCLPVLSWKSWKSFTKEVGRAILSMH
jgi:hypothetical protein